MHFLKLQYTINSAQFGTKSPNEPLPKRFRIIKLLFTLTNASLLKDGFLIACDIIMSYKTRHKNLEKAFFTN